MMKTLLITNYWTPYNDAGTIRWWNFAKYIPLDVLTTRRTRGLYDETLEERGHNIQRVRNFSNISCLNGLLLSIHSLFAKADIYVFTTPSETLLLGAWLNQLLGRKVVIDVRDKIDRPHQPVKLLVPLYKWLYQRIKNVVVVDKVVDDTKSIIQHGHDSLRLKYNKQYPMPKGRFIHKDYNEMLQRGFVPKQKVEDYPQSSFANLDYMWGGDSYKPWKHQASLMGKYLEML